MIQIEATKILLAYKAKLKEDILILRKQACDKAEIVRAIEKCISPQDELDLVEWLNVQDAFSIRGIDHIIFNKEKVK